ncbi:GrpB family protein [Erwinia sp. 198]|uniref:GrpB family protein n=1 Tax=Erwinia sp. 198 TaxID=2022746 RepID=UPI000F68382A|nr:GrpB family protein [Erwinia sp. 198]RRZ86773.1 hypothetical protein EGK14_20380 [Erwinia sp. 198]
MRKAPIVAYDRQWPALYEAESLLLQITRGNITSQIPYINSASVPGLSTKPVIDILPEVVGLNAPDSLNAFYNSTLCNKIPSSTA